ncbi:lactonase family protein [Beijerinckia indica]|uniref:Putative 3-carboxymuconate cyclase n=1 Tax=Beijerinckia indica subsp. indica (strain ATCC 9039 / DSM 1715 / NCIMB 8712) TaxID=395963 RepID=B2ICM6_BEII9|nr:beta-propeller fold lactonase family protein [Beijerinckia indica]ACB93915.1 putative 3-carboxymuconate cyclase [Beijerinckia indica subsp. indica ATCC 9039]
MRSILKITGSSLAALAAIFSLSSAAVAQSLQERAHGTLYTMSNAVNGNAILAFRQTETGELSPAGSFPTGGLGTGGGLGNAGGLVLSQDQHWLFAVNAGSNEISVFAIDDEGRLRLASKTASGGGQPVSIAVDDDLVYVLNANSDLINGFRLKRDGRLEQIPGSLRALGGTGTNPAEIAFSPDGQSLIISEKATNRLAVFKVDRAGLTDNAPGLVPSAGLTPFGFAFSHRKTLLVTEAGGGTNGSTLSSYHLRRDELPVLVDGAVRTTQSAACWVAVTPDGRYAYTSNAASQSITGFRVAPSGDLTLLDADGVTASTAGNGNPIDSVISRDGQFLYVLSAGKDTIGAFKIGHDGGLTPIAALQGLPASANGLAIR